MIKGNGVSTGIGFGTVVVLRKENKQIEKNVVENPEEEMKRFKECIFNDIARSYFNCRNRKCDNESKL